MVGLRDAASIQAKVIEFQSRILDAQGLVFAAQENRATLVERIRDLEQSIARMEAWDTEKQRYELKELGQGTLAYAPKESVSSSEPPHWICAQCYEAGKKSILQPEVRFPGRTEVYVCHSCGSELIASGGRDATLSAPRPTSYKPDRRR